MSLALPAALAGAADTTAFMATRTALFREHPGRALGSVGMLALWLGGAAAARSKRPSTAGVATVAVLVAANSALLTAHLKAGVSSPRVVSGAALSAIVLRDVIRRR